MAHKTGPDVKARHEVCLRCQFWQGRCLKNFDLSSMMGCPEKKFPPVGAAGYAPNHSLVVGVANPDCCGSRPPAMLNALQPVDHKLTAGQVAAQFTRSMIDWARKGLPVVSEKRHADRYRQCQACPHYRFFLCQKCACVSYLKTKLETERCPDVPPRWT